MEPASTGNAAAAAGGNVVALVSEDSGMPVFMLLSDGPAARRGQELVLASDRRAAAADGRARYGRPALCGQGAADHHRLDRVRRLGVGGGFICRRATGVQEADLRDAVRSGQRGVYAVWAVLYWVKSAIGEAGRVAEWVT